MPAAALDRPEMLAQTWWVSPWPLAAIIAILVIVTAATHISPVLRHPVLIAAAFVVYAWYGPVTLAANVYLLAMGFIGMRLIAAGRNCRTVLVLLLLLPMVADNMIVLLAGQSAWKSAGAVGISYLTLQLIGHVIDTASKVVPPVGLGAFVTAHTLFFKIAAGPIARARQILVERRSADIESGFMQAVYGAFIKMVVSDNLWEQIVRIDPASGLSGAWLYATGFIAHLYLDFSGYSHMAIGAGRMLGYDLPANFRRPFVAMSISDFWRRWHMSLSFWLRDYVFYRLARARWLPGSQPSLTASFIVMLLVGLWHGFAVGFVIWGMLHGSIIVAERYWALRGWSKPPAAIQLMLTWLFLVASFVPFAFPTQWTGPVLSLLGLNGFGRIAISDSVPVVCMVACLVIDHVGHAWFERSSSWVRMPIEVRVSVATVAIVLIWALGFSGAEFLYATF